MTVSQRDARSVRIEHDGLVFSLAYRFWWEGRDRSPESIAVEGDRVRAFFLSADIRDSLAADAHGVLVRREWSVRSPGPVRLAVDVRLEPDGPVAFLLPGVALSDGLPAEGVAAHGGRTAWPSAAGLTIGGRGIVGFAIDEGPVPSGIAFAPVDQEDLPPAEREDGPSPLSLALTLPGPDAAGRPVGGRSGTVESTGTLEAARTFRIVSAPARRAWLRGAAAVLAALGGWPAARAKGKAVRDAVAGAVTRCLETHRYERGGVAGLRIDAAGPLLSASAGAGMAVLLRELFPADPAMAELALRLADFSLKAQHPSGLFYENFHADRAEWQGVPGRGGRSALGIAEAARTADRLLAFADSLRSAGLPCRKYQLAGERFVEFFFDDRGRFQLPGALHLPGVREPAEPGLAGLELCFPLARVLERTGHDRHRKALDALGHELAALPWGTPWLPSTGEERGPDSAGALLCARVALELARGGAIRRNSSSASHGRARPRTATGPVDVGDAASVVLPWVYANPRPPVAGVTTLGGIVESFHDQRLAGAGAEAGWVLAGLADLAVEPWMRRTLEGFSRMCVAFADGLPPGTSHVAHLAELAAAAPAADARGRGRRREGASTASGPVVGPVDARRLVREAGFRLAIAAGRGRGRLLA